MKHITLLVFLISTSFGFLFSKEQLIFKDTSKVKIPRFYKSEIGNSKCSAYFPIQKPKIDVSYSEDSSIVYTFDELVGEHHFSMIHINLANNINDSLEQQTVLINYSNYLQGLFKAVESMEYGLGHTLSSDSKTQGLIGFWIDSDKTEYAMKSWINANHLTIFLIYGKGEYPYYNVKEMFFNGIRYN